MRIDFDWDPAKAASNIAKHDGVTFVEADDGARMRSVGRRSNSVSRRPPSYRRCAPWNTATIATSSTASSTS
jgi:uncharacterized DUF497 family protein